MAGVANVFPLNTNRSVPLEDFPDIILAQIQRNKNKVTASQTEATSSEAEFH